MIYLKKKKQQLYINHYTFISLIYFKKNCNCKQYQPILYSSVRKQSPQKYINPVAEDSSVGTRG